MHGCVLYILSVRMRSPVYLLAYVTSSVSLCAASDGEEGNRRWKHKHVDGTKCLQKGNLIKVKWKDEPGAIEERE